MASRPDVKVDFSDSPRVALVNAPSREFNAQDIVDTLRLEEETFRGQSETKLLNASGKEQLGGGVQVGVTVELQNTEIAFQGRTTPAQIGTVTQTTGAAVAERQTLYDTNALFLTNLVHRGALIINFTDGSIAEVRNIISETEIEARGLVNGTDNLFELGDDYQIFRVYQCEVLGGNVVGVDENGVSASPILPTAFTQVVRTASASATTQNLLALEHASYDNGVTIDVINGVAGTEYPIGSGIAPSNNLTDAYTIASGRGLQFFYVRGFLEINSTIDWSGHIFKGTSPTTTQINVLGAANISQCEIWDAYVTGDVDSSFIIRNCVVGAITLENGFIWESSIIGPILLGSGEAHIINCWSQIPGATSPQIDMNGSGTSLGLRNYTGGIHIINKTGPESVSIDMNSGHVNLDSTITDGLIVVRGVGKLTDNTTGTTVVNSDNYLQADVIQDSIERTTFIGSAGPGVHIDTEPGHGTLGTAWPTGTLEQPCLLLTDALTIAEERSFTTLYITHGTLEIDVDIMGKTIVGDSVNTSTVICKSGTGSPEGSPLTAMIQDNTFKNLNISGVFDGNNIIRECLVHDIFGIAGFIYECALFNTITVAGSLSIQNCWIAPPATEQSVIIDFDNLPSTVIVSDWSAGRVVAKNMVTGSFLGVAGGAGRVVIDSANTGGTVVYAGGILVDDTFAANIDFLRNSSVAGSVWEEKTTNHTTVGTFGAANDTIEVTVANMSSVIDDLIKYQRNKSVIDGTLYTLTIFEDDGVTPLTVFDLKDEAGLASITSIFQRIPQIGSP